MTNILYLQTFLFLLASLKYIEHTYSYPTLHGRYTRDINKYELALPHKLTHHGKFLSFSLPHYFKHESHNRRKKRQASDAVDYGLVLDGTYHHLRLWPNNKLLSPHAFIEHRDPTIDLEKRKLKMLKGTKVCHYTGRVKGVPDSSIALSTCDGLAGHIRMKGKSYLVEPLQHHAANKKGHHMHLVYKREITSSSEGVKFCGTSDDWVKDWKKRYRSTKSVEKHSTVQHPKRTVKSLPRYIEILAVCDKLFMDTHKHIDVQTYVLTFFNMVYDLYHDASIGNRIDVSLVRIIYFEKEEDEIDIQVKPEAIGTLERFCQWQQTINPKDIKSPIHHDVAILVTRYDICDHTIPGDGCVLLGLAYVGTPCTGAKPCAYCEEGGLSIGYVITHELGHVMGCSHDNFEISGCNRNAPDGSTYVMSDTASDNITSWSSCSKDYITTLLDAGFGECLNDEPDESAYRFPHMLPGIVYDGNVQCSWIQQGSKLCSFANDEICENLLCNPVNTTKCLQMFGKLAMPGTKCAENKWCYKSKCVDKGKRPDAIDGGWGEWGNWGECTRTCGGGVKIKKRTCNNPTPEHGGRFCVGERKNIKMCNWQVCPEGSKDYRSVQCAAFNNKTVMGKKAVWTPYVFPEEPCVLYCLDDKNEYSKLANRAKDGTKCRIGSRDACIAGMCKKIGCDYAIDSDLEEDTCGVCGGTGKTCTIVRKTITEVKKGYYFAAELPRGAFNVRVAEKEPCENTLALGDETGKLCLNANNEEFPDGVYSCANISFVYTHPELDKELLVIRGPLTQSLFLYVRFYVKRNVGFEISYADLTKQRPGYTPEYRWDHIDFSPCSHLCEGGTQVSYPSCVEAEMGKLNPDYCKGVEKPEAITRICNEKPCEIRWRVGAWGACKACKGAAGVRVREVECVKEPRKEGGDDVIIEEDKCTDTRPPSRDYCISKRSCIKRRTGTMEFPQNMMKELFYQTIVDMLDLDPELKAYFVAQARTIRALRRHLRHYKRAIDLQQLCAYASATDNITSTSEANDLTNSNGSTTGDVSGSGVNGTDSDNKVITGANQKIKIQIGSNIFDQKHPERLKIAEVHSGGSVPLTNISEEAFQSIGNVIENTLVIDHKKNFTGDKALQCLAELQNVGRNHSI